ncbi:hypothetical protein LCGC14_3114750, partial [marine sediment metagenome]
EETSTRRLNFAQSFNPMGSLAGMFVAKNFIQARLDPRDTAARMDLSPSEFEAVKSHDLSVLANPYIVIGIVIIVMLIVIAFVKMPRNADRNRSIDLIPTLKRILSIPRYREGVIAQFFYVGAQIMCWTYLYQYAESFGINNENAVNYGIAALSVFIIGRWVGTAMLRYINPAKLLLFFSFGAIICTLVTIFVPGMTGLYALVAISFFMSIMFPTIYGIALEGRGEDAKFGAAFLVMAIVGGALMPTLQGLILDLGGLGYTDVRILGVPEVNFSFVLPLFCFVIVAIYSRNVFAHKYKNNNDDSSFFFFYISSLFY